MKTRTAIVIAILTIGSSWLFVSQKSDEHRGHSPAQIALATKFQTLSQGGNSSCSGAFLSAIPAMGEGKQLTGSCCSPMSMHRYSEQVEGLKKFKAETSQNISEIPDDPYDIDSTLAKKLKNYYDLELTAGEQKVYDYAMEHSDEKGPCCCKCWRWYVYGGLGKHLIHSYGFSGEQLTKVWNLSDGCGGDEEHQHG